MFKKIASRLMLVLMFVTLTSCAGRDSDTSSAPKESTSTSSDKSANNDEKTTENVGDRTTIVFWHSMGGNLNDAIDHLVDEYNNSQDKYFVKAEFQGEYDDALTKLRSSASGKDVGADLVQVFDLGTR